MASPNPARMVSVVLGHAQSPVVRFRHGRTRRVVTMVGTSHVGEAGYSERLNALVGSLEAAGAVVYGEGMGFAGEKERAAASAAERAGREVEQRHALPHGSSWRNADMTDLEFTRQGATAGHEPGEHDASQPASRHERRLRGSRAGAWAWIDDDDDDSGAAG